MIVVPSSCGARRVDLARSTAGRRAPGASSQSDAVDAAAASVDSTPPGLLARDVGQRLLLAARSAGTRAAASPSPSTSSRTVSPWLAAATLPRRYAVARSRSSGSSSARSMRRYSGDLARRRAGQDEQAVVATSTRAPRNAGRRVGERDRRPRASTARRLRSTPALGERDGARADRRRSSPRARARGSRARSAALAAARRAAPRVDARLLRVERQLAHGRAVRVGPAGTRVSPPLPPGNDEQAAVDASRPAPPSTPARCPRRASAAWSARAAATSVVTAPVSVSVRGRRSPIRTRSSAARSRA